MKRIILGLVVSSVMLLADTATIEATMKSMKQGVEQVQSGFIYNNKQDIIKGIQAIEDSNAMFGKVDVSKFIPNNSKIQVTKNINHNLATHIKKLKMSVESNDFSKATKAYGEMINDCISCHTIIRSW